MVTLARLISMQEPHDGTPWKGLLESVTRWTERVVSDLEKTFLAVWECVRRADPFSYLPKWSSLNSQYVIRLVSAILSVCESQTS